MIWLLACLPAVPEPEPEGRPLREDRPEWSQTELILDQSPFWTGRLLSGGCGGPVLAEAVDDGIQLTFAVLEQKGAYVLFLPELTDYSLRYGCDEDRDGVVPAAALAVLNLTEATQRRVDLMVPVPLSREQVVLLSPDQVGGAVAEKMIPPPGMEPLENKGAPGAPPPGGSPPAAPPLGSGPPSGPEAPGSGPPTPPP